MDDILASLDDAVLEALKNRKPMERSARSEDWTEYFYDPDRNKYDWDDPEWKRENEKSPHGFYPIYLTRGYFMIVSRRDYELMTTYPDGRPKKWHANVQKDDEGNITKVYACRRGKEGEPRTVFAHREIPDCLHEKGDVDHVNNWSLDNRRQNLLLGPRVHNIRNTTGNRRKNFSLLPGVEERGFNSKGQKLYGGIRSKRIKKKGPGSVRTFRTKRTWRSQLPANKWYLNQIKRLSSGRTSWAHTPKTVNYPAFPPRMESEPTLRSSALRARAQVRVTADIPF